jgi:monooxygenase
VNRLAAFPADAFVSATGLQLNLMGDVSFFVDGEPVDWVDTWTYKGMVFSGVPNLVSVFGYVNAS